MKLRIVNRLHRRNRVNCRNFRPSLGILNDDIARQHGPHLVLDLQRFVGERRIARAQDDVGSKIDIDLGLERMLDIDPADDTEALFLKSGFNALDRIVELERQRGRKVVALRGSSISRGQLSIAQSSQAHTP